MAKKKLPEINLIDLDQTASPDWEAVPKETYPTDTEGSTEASSPRPKFRINIHMVMIAVILVTILVIVIKFSNWGQFIDPETNAGNGDNTDYDIETMDSILPLTDEAGNLIAPDLTDGLSIAVFGNTPFSDDRDSEEGLAAMLAEMADATVYNFSIGNSYLASTQAHPYVEVNPWDAFTFYWLAILTTDIGVNDYVADALNYMGESAPPEIAEVHSLFSAVDFDTIDIFVILYDATDYLMGHTISNPDNPTDIQSFIGNLTAGINLLQEAHPNARIIVMSPPYAFSAEQDENGSYISSGITRYGGNVLPGYASQQSTTCDLLQVSFVDNIYGTFNEDVAAEYLTDNLHLNAAGRQKIAERLVSAITYFDSFYQ